MNPARRRQMEAKTPTAQAKVLRRLYGAAAASVARSFASSASTSELARFWNDTADLIEKEVK